MIVDFSLNFEIIKRNKNALIASLHCQFDDTYSYTL